MSHMWEWWWWGVIPVPTIRRGRRGAAMHSIQPGPADEEPLCAAVGCVTASSLSAHSPLPTPRDPHKLYMDPVETMLVLKKPSFEVEERHKGRLVL